MKIEFLSRMKKKMREKERGSWQAKFKQNKNNGLEYSIKRKRLLLILWQTSAIQGEPWGHPKVAGTWVFRESREPMCPLHPDSSQVAVGGLGLELKPPLFLKIYRYILAGNFKHVIPMLLFFATEISSRIRLLKSYYRVKTGNWRKGNSMDVEK